MKNILNYFFQIFFFQTTYDFNFSSTNNLYTSSINKTHLFYSSADSTIRTAESIIFILNTIPIKYKLVHRSERPILKYEHLSFGISISFHFIMISENQTIPVQWRISFHSRTTIALHKQIKQYHHYRIHIFHRTPIKYLYFQRKRKRL